MRLRRLVAPVLAVAACLAAAPTAAARTVWLCKPGLVDNPCLADLTTTVVRADGSTSIERARRARRPKVDCFYVYPTVSGQPTVNATRAIDPEICAIAVAQASRFSTVCRPFAPVYRQLTIAALGTPGAITLATAGVAFRDVLEAWREYLRRYNRGRGVVVVGHSQGTFMLRELLRRVVDGRRAVRRRLVSAVLIGGNVTVRRGSNGGGDFKRIPACRRARQIRCVVAYSAFRRKPPPNTRFGTPTGRFLSPRPGEGYEVLCTNPATLSGARGLLRPYYPSRRMPGPIGAVQPDPPAVRTPWASTPRAFRARCRTESAMSWLDVDHIGGPNDVRPQPTETLGPTWGLHLVDVNIAYGNLVELVRRQARTYLSR